MWVLFAIAFLLLLIYIGYIMSRLDEFLVKNSVAINIPVAIVMGNDNLSRQVSSLLRKNNADVLHLEEPFLLKKEKNFRYVFALSENDTDNIILCRTVRKIYRIEEMISICNDRGNEGMYISEKINYMYRENASASMICKAVLKKAGVEIL